MEIVRGLRLGEFDVLVGINLLREGLDLPEVALVAILDADQEGFLRSDRSLIQTVGRAARNLRGRAVLYADRVTGSMERALSEMSRRRAIQEAHNREHGIIPASIRKSVDQVRLVTRVADARAARPEPVIPPPAELDRAELIEVLERQMREAAAELDFELAAQLRDQIFELKAERDPTRQSPQRGRAAGGKRAARRG
jgi:excinuclease ABC subunit B